MKGAKWRYDDKKLSKSSSLKKQIALILAADYVKNINKLSTIEIFAFGLKERPFAAYSDKGLLKAFDDLYMKKLSNLEQEKDLYKEYKDNGGRSGWSFEVRIKEAQTQIDEMQPFVDELIEEAFSE